MASTKKTVVSFVIGAITSVAAVSAAAGEWSEWTVLSELIVEEDKTIQIRQHGSVWPNPDACTSADVILLLPPGAGGGPEGYKELYAALLAANLTGHKVQVFVEGCASVGAQTVPVFSRVAVYGQRARGRGVGAARNAEGLQ